MPPQTWPCSVCVIPIKRSNYCVLCLTCRQWVHRKCSGLRHMDLYTNQYECPACAPRVIRECPAPIEWSHNEANALDYAIVAIPSEEEHICHAYFYEAQPQSNTTSVKNELLDEHGDKTETTNDGTQPTAAGLNSVHEESEEPAAKRAKLDTSTDDADAAPSTVPDCPFIVRPISEPAVKFESADADSEIQIIKEVRRERPMSEQQSAAAVPSIECEFENCDQSFTEHVRLLVHYYKQHSMTLQQVIARRRMEVTRLHCARKRIKMALKQPSTTADKVVTVGGGRAVGPEVNGQTPSLSVPMVLCHTNTQADLDTLTSMIDTSKIIVYSRRTNREVWLRKECLAVGAVSCEQSNTLHSALAARKQTLAGNDLCEASAQIDKSKPEDDREIAICVEPISQSASTPTNPVTHEHPASKAQPTNQSVSVQCPLSSSLHSCTVTAVSSDTHTITASAPCTTSTASAPCTTSTASAPCTTSAVSESPEQIEVSSVAVPKHKPSKRFFFCKLCCTSWSGTHKGQHRCRWLRRKSERKQRAKHNSQSATQKQKENNDDDRVSVLDQQKEDKTIVRLRDQSVSNATLNGEPLTARSETEAMRKEIETLRQQQAALKHENKLLQLRAAQAAGAKSEVVAKDKPNMISTIPQQSVPVPVSHVRSVVPSVSALPTTGTTTSNLFDLSAVRYRLRNEQNFEYFREQWMAYRARVKATGLLQCVLCVTECPVTDIDALMSHFYRLHFTAATFGSTNRQPDRTVPLYSPIGTKRQPNVPVPVHGATVMARRNYLTKHLRLNRPLIAVNRRPIAVNRPPLAVNRPPLAVNRPPLAVNRPPVLAMTAASPAWCHTAEKAKQKWHVLSNKVHHRLSTQHDSLDGVKVSGPVQHVRLSGATSAPAPTKKWKPTILRQVQAQMTQRQEIDIDQVQCPYCDTKVHGFDSLLTHCTQMHNST